MPSASAPEEENSQGLFALTEEIGDDEGHWELIGSSIQEEWEDATEEDKGTSGDSNQNGRKLISYDQGYDVFVVDCLHSKYSHGGTNDKITVYFYTSTGEYIGKDDTDSFLADATCNNQWGKTWFLPLGKTEWDYVDIESSGTDAYMIDQAWAEETTLHSRKDDLRFGKDNAGVWCVSNDPDDKLAGGWSCRRKLRFVANTSGSWMKRGKVYGWKQQPAAMLVSSDMGRNVLDRTKRATENDYGRSGGGAV